MIYCFFKRKYLVYKSSATIIMIIRILIGQQKFYDAWLIT